MSHTTGVQYETTDRRFFSHFGLPVAASSARIFGSFISSRTSTTVPPARIGEAPLPKFPAIVAGGISNLQSSFPERS